MTKDKMEMGFDLIKDAYNNELRTIIKEAKREVKLGRIISEDELIEWLEQTVDGHEYIMYTWQAQAVLLASENSNTYLEEFGSEGFIKDGEINWEVLAYSAMLLDLQQLMPPFEELTEEKEDSEENTD